MRGSWRLSVAAAIGLLLAALSKRRSQARLFILAFGSTTALTLVVTVLHWSYFMADPLPNRPVWILDYVLDPVFGLALVPAAGLWPPRQATRHPLTLLFRIEALVFGALGLVLLLLPNLAIAYWPWLLPPELGQFYGCLILTFALGGGLASRESEPRAIRDFLTASTSLCMLVLVMSAVDVDGFRTGPMTAIWFAALALGAVAFGVGSGAQTQATARGRSFGIILLAGLIAALAAGSDARGAMRVVALSANMAPQFTWPGTASIVRFAVAVGLLAAIGYALVVLAISDSDNARRFLPRPLWRGVGFGVLISLVGVITNLFTPLLPPEDVRLGVPLLNITLFATLPLIFGLALGGTETVLDRYLG